MKSSKDINDLLTSKRKLLSRKVQESVQDLIVKELKPGELIPSQAELCERFQVGAGTVAKAVENLEKAGMVIRQHGCGTFVTDPKAPLIAVIVTNWMTVNHVALLEKPLAMATSQGRIRYRFYDRDPRSEFVSKLIEDRVQGVISLNLRREERNQLLKHRIHLIIDDWIEDLDGVDVVNMDGFRAGKLAAETLINAGHSKIGFVGFQPWSKKRQTYMGEHDVELRLAGLTAAMLDYGKPINPSWVIRLRLPSPFESRADTFTAAQACSQLFKSSSGSPTALIFADQRHSAEAMLPEIASSGLVIAKDLSAVCIDYFENVRSFTAVGCSLESWIKKASELITSHFASAQEGSATRVLLDVSVLHRNSIQALSA